MSLVGDNQCLRVCLRESEREKDSVEHFCPFLTGWGGGGTQPLGSLIASGVAQTVEREAVIGDPGGCNRTGANETIQSRIDLTDIHGAALGSASGKLAVQLKAVGRAHGQQGEEPTSNRHTAYFLGHRWPEFPTENTVMPRGNKRRHADAWYPTVVLAQLRGA